VTRPKTKTNIRVSHKNAAVVAGCSGQGIIAVVHGRTGTNSSGRYHCAVCVSSSFGTAIGPYEEQQQQQQYPDNTVHFPPLGRAVSTTPTEISVLKLAIDGDVNYSSGEDIFVVGYVLLVTDRVKLQSPEYRT
jgi:hypothetical protein